MNIVRAGFIATLLVMAICPRLSADEFANRQLDQRRQTRLPAVIRQRVEAYERAFRIQAEIGILPARPERPREAADGKAVPVDEAKPPHVRVLLIDSHAGWNFRMLSRVLVREESITVEKAILQDLDMLAKADFLKFDVVVLGDVDPKKLGRRNLDNLKKFVDKQGGGLLLIAGSQHSPWKYVEEPLSAMLPIDVKRAVRPERKEAMQATLAAAAVRLPMFRFFKAMQLEAGIRLPSVFLQVEAPTLPMGVTVLAAHPERPKVPVIAVHDYGAGRVMFHAAEDTWRWRMKGKGTQAYDHFWVETMRYLARSKDRD